jgi:hypothetical protein
MDDIPVWNKYTSSGETFALRGGPAGACEISTSHPFTI